MKNKTKNFMKSFIPFYGAFEMKRPIEQQFGFGTYMFNLTYTSLFCVAAIMYGIAAQSIDNWSLKSTINYYLEKRQEHSFKFEQSENLMDNINLDGSNSSGYNLKELSEFFELAEFNPDSADLGHYQVRKIVDSLSIDKIVELNEIYSQRKEK